MMADPRITVLEKQHDELAGRVASLAEELRLLRRVLCRPNVATHLGIRPEDLEPLSGNWVASTEASRQWFARQDAIRAARKDALLQRVERVERYARASGKSFASAWDACATRE